MSRSDAPNHSQREIIEISGAAATGLINATRELTSQGILPGVYGQQRGRFLYTFMTPASERFGKEVQPDMYVALQIDGDYHLFVAYSMAQAFEVMHFVDQVHPAGNERYMQLITTSVLPPQRPERPMIHLTGPIACIFGIIMQARRRETAEVLFLPPSDGR